VLSDSGDLREAAANLYAALHRFDKAGLDIIIADKFPDTCLGKTINDLLKKTSSKG
jgi:L-threonylcarbamoyladenylate synthase